MNVFTPENLAQYDAVLFESTTQLKFKDPAQREALLNFVKGGKGFIGIHAASDNFPTWPEAVEMIGGQFDGHPWTAGGSGPKESDGWSMKVDDPDHPINKSFGGKGFVLKDEIYQIKGPYSRDTHRVLLSLDMSKPSTKAPIKNGKKGQAWGGRADGDHAISWIKRYGEGRVFYCSLGHRKEIYWDKPVLEHYLAGIQYALGDFKVDDTPSAKLDKQPTPALAPK
jgi:type 1 glutamine amidotransferase